MFFFGFDTKSKATKAKINQWNSIKLKSFCGIKDTINTMKKQPTEWEKIFANHVSDKELICKMYEELKELNSKRKTT